MIDSNTGIQALSDRTNFTQNAIIGSVDVTELVRERTGLSPQQEAKNQDSHNPACRELSHNGLQSDLNARVPALMPIAVPA